MALDPIPKYVFDILACPRCKGSLRYNNIKTKLICQKCKKIYKIRQGIPVLLP